MRGGEELLQRMFEPLGYKVNATRHPLVERKLAGPEKGRLEAADMNFHEREFERLVAELESAAEKSVLPERATGKNALNDLLVRLRVNDMIGGES